MSDTHFTKNKCAKPSLWFNKLLVNKWEEIKESLISDIISLKPDAIIHCGDFTHFGTLEDYAYGKAILDATGIEWYGVPGNHDAYNDDVKNEMRKEFALTEGNSFFYSRVFGGIAIAFLDVCILKRDKLFSIEDGALKWLEDFLINNCDKAVFLVCHIPICHDTVISDCGTYVNKNDMPTKGKIYSSDIKNVIGEIENVSKIRKIIKQNGNVKIVFSGHWHIDSLHIRNDIHYKIVPSVCDYPCEVVVVDCDDPEIKLYNKAIGTPVMQRDSFISEWNNTWAAGAHKAANTILLMASTQYG